MFQFNDAWVSVVDELVELEIQGRGIPVEQVDGSPPTGAAGLRVILLARIDADLQAEIALLFENLIISRLGQLSDRELFLILGDQDLDGVDPSLVFEACEQSLEDQRRRFCDPDLKFDLDASHSPP